ncbi:MAG: 50S ribosomal protein L4 [Candidatus Nealsonbacteria bacterium CG_4_10_14_0_2_um_filter_35_20]|uniref:Large ribosomal subunit protein uL4 n=1 Tax=Candidatus Nealsonbacteria bacterium CG02_land_8_20_14_3_00_34_20 TaxID=1974698 RepID=A0A2M7DAT3_9BACT|nr:MAG: 50S ribosomal protein L4 [Candidatus Nealsonbacteria bacterium CG02_land_8_20_14_3_00_34_20]PIZ89895.1 MAG: 50S ribosomal protein L4 [Candidatus Nealsonbacteria bacterium CG_4_10_14_0_2_um_filter_35_20]
MKVSVYDQQGKEIGTTLLPKEIFEVPMNLDLLHQIVTSSMANERRVIAHAKNRGEVRGGGKKPWKQKGTGRSRQGSIRSPLWKGGGVTFGPRNNRVFKKKIPKKMRKKALFMVLSEKLRHNLLILLEELKINSSKTKLLMETLGRFPINKESCLIALPEMDKTLILAAKNIPQVKMVQAKDLNCKELLLWKYLILPKESLKVIKETFK